MVECTDPNCRFRRAHLYGRISPRLNLLITGLILLAADTIEHDGVELSGYTNRRTRKTIYLDDNGNAYGFGADGMIEFATPGEAIGALCTLDQDSAS